MAKGKPRIRQRPVPLPIQQLNLRRVWPDLHTKLARNILVATGSILPAALTQRYRVRLEYRLGNDPKVWVEEPRIMAARGPGEFVPHVYDRSTEPRPCLFYSHTREWDSGKLLAYTVLPWLLAWLSFYEVWLATGAWIGGGIDHGGQEK